MRIPGALELRKLASRLVQHYRPRAPAPSSETWNAQYASGRWDYLGQLRELARFSLLVGYLRHFRPGGAILDIGCGEGVLLKRLQAGDYCRYVGVDISSVAIEKANALGDPKATFTAADGQLYEPTETFDVIVINEAIYFFTDPFATVERYARALNTQGILIIVVNTAFRGGVEILDRLKERYVLLDETRVTHGTNTWSWVCTVLGARGP